MKSTAEDKKNQVSYVKIREHNVEQRIDNFLFTHFKGVPKTRIYRALRKGEVRINKKRIKAHYKLQLGDEIRLPPLRVVAIQANHISTKLASVQALESCIVYEDDGLIVLNKPAGMAVHGGSGISFGIIEALRVLRPNIPGLALVHRLDRDTSGCLLIAKKRSSLRALHEALREKQVEKTYLALVQGHWSKRTTLVKVPLQRFELQSGERIVTATEDGKISETQFRLMELFDDVSLVEAKPLTGRTHQIRVHASFKGHPLAGDDKYGDNMLNKKLQKQGIFRLFLHAARLRFMLPGKNKEMVVEAPLPNDLKKALSNLRS